MADFRFFLILSLFPVFLSGCWFSSGPVSTCVDCHKGLEHVSATHNDCVACHGGDATAADKDISHRGMFGKKNPSDPSVWDKSCGTCHPYQLERVKSTLMFTGTGIIKGAQETWEGVDGNLYSSRGVDVHNAEGEPVHLAPVKDLNNLAGELYRKGCVLCHVGIETNVIWSGSHGSGCAACHFPYNDNATYQGEDETVKGKWPYSATHEMQVLPDNQTCTRCHNRSGRIGYSYQGLNDGNNGLVPTDNGFIGPVVAGGSRNLTSIAPDIHHEKGMECIDCHTSRDLMGDGYAYENMFLQVEVTCEDCHGSATDRPLYQAVERENDEAIRESQHYERAVKMGDQLILTSKGRKYSNVFWEEDKVWVVGKRTGKRHESKVITDTPEHSIAGHERMACYSCHSQSVVQCYGCHTQYDLRERGRDYVKQMDTPGVFTETEDYRMLYPFPLALDQRGKVSPVTPGCQTFVTVIERDGSRSKDGYVALYKGKQQLRFAPFFGHNVGKKAVSCNECHTNPAFVGFGQHVVEGDSVRATLICEKSQDKPLDGFVTLQDGDLKAFSAITRENSRPLNATEIGRTWAVNQCLVCHRDPKDPIYQKELDYRVLDDCLARPASARTFDSRRD
jgi:hypothetical protein